MNEFAVLLQGFFAHLINQRDASRHTITAYRDTIRLFLGYASAQTGKTPSNLVLPDLDADQVTGFLTWLETDRHNSVRTRNTRLAGLKSFYHYASYRAVEHADVIRRVLAIPPKREQKAIVEYLTLAEAQALINAPDTTTWIGRRDQTLLHLACHTGLRVSELTGLTRADITLDHRPWIDCHGKGRKQRLVPLNPTTAKLATRWLKELPTDPATVVFPTTTGTQLSRDAVAKLVTKHARHAATDCPSLTGRNISPHTLRHTCAMLLLQSGVDQAVIALWLGHASTQTTDIYLHADMTLKEKALAKTTPAGATPGRYHAPDSVLAFLDRL